MLKYLVYVYMCETTEGEGWNRHKRHKIGTLTADSITHAKHISDAIGMLDGHETETVCRVYHRGKPIDIPFYDLAHVANDLERIVSNIRGGRMS